MHHHTSFLKFPLPHHAPPNPNHHHYHHLNTLLISLSVLSAGPHHSLLTCNGIQVSVPHQCRSSSSTTTTSNRNGAAAAHDWKLRSAGTKTIDVSTLGNLCVDIVLNVPKLPQPSREARQAYMEQLSTSPPDKKYWEAGGNCNVAIAAARLGLHCATPSSVVRGRQSPS